MYLYNFRCPSCLPWRVTSTCVYTARVTPTYSTKDFWCVREIIASYCSQVRFDTFCSYTVFISLYKFFYSPHQTMFEDVSGFGAWQRLFFKLEGGILYYWNYPNEMGSKVGNGTALIWQIVLKNSRQYSFLCCFSFLLSCLLFLFQPAEGSISLCGFDSVRPVERDSCARPHTFELVNSRTLQQDHSRTLTKYDVLYII